MTPNRDCHVPCIVPVQLMSLVRYEVREEHKKINFSL